MQRHELESPEVPIGTELATEVHWQTALFSFSFLRGLICTTPEEPEMMRLL